MTKQNDLLNALSRQRQDLEDLRKETVKYMTETKQHGESILARLANIKSAYDEALREYQSKDTNAESLQKERESLLEGVKKVEPEIVGQEKKTKEAAEEQRLVHDLAKRKFDYRRELSRLTSLRERVDEARKRVAEIDSMIGGGK